MLTQDILDAAADHVAANGETVFVEDVGLLAMTVEDFVETCVLAGYTDTPNTLMAVSQEGHVVVFMRSDGNTIFVPIEPSHIVIPEMN